jgi:hypothetical protein
VADITGLEFVPGEALDSQAIIRFTSVGGYIITRRTGVGALGLYPSPTLYPSTTLYPSGGEFPVTPTDPGWTQLASVYPSTGGTVTIALPTNDDDYLVAVVCRDAGGALTGPFSTCTVFGLAVPELLAFDAYGAVGMVTTTRAVGARFEVDVHPSWPFGEAGLAISAGLSTFPVGTVADPATLTSAGGTPFPESGLLPAGSDGMLVRAALPKFISRRYVRFAQESVLS